MIAGLDRFSSLCTRAPITSCERSPSRKLGVIGWPERMPFTNRRVRCAKRNLPTAAPRSLVSSPARNRSEIGNSARTFSPAFAPRSRPVIQVPALGEVAIIGESMRDAVLFGECLRLAGCALAHRHHIHVVTRAVAEQMHEAEAGANDPYAERLLRSLRHEFLLFSEL